MSTDESKRQNWLREIGLLNPGSWCPLVFTFMQYGESGAILLSVLLGQMSAEIAAEKDEDLWMRMPTNRIRAKLQTWTAQKVKRTLRQIEDLIEVKMTGVPKKSRQRWVRLRLDRLHEVLRSRSQGVKNDPSSQGVKNDPTQGVKNDPTRIEENCRIDTAIASASHTVRVKSIQFAPYREFAQRLHEMVQSVRKVSSTARPGSWAQSFRTLHKRGVPIERIEAALDWYKATLKRYGDLMRAGTTYVPIAYSGPKWLDKWESLEAAMERDRAGEGREEGRKLNVRMKVVEKSSRSRVDEWGFEK